MMASAASSPSSTTATPPPSRKRTADGEVCGTEDPSSTENTNVPAPPSERVRQDIIEHTHRSRFAMRSVAVGAFYMARDEGMTSYLRLLPTDMCEAIIVPMINTGYAGVLTTSPPISKPAMYACKHDNGEKKVPYCATGINILPVFSYEFACLNGSACEQCRPDISSKLRLRCPCRPGDGIMLAQDGLFNRSYIISNRTSDAGRTSFYASKVPSLSRLLETDCVSPPMKFLGHLDEGLASGDKLSSVWMVAASVLPFSERLAGVFAARFSDRHGEFHRVAKFTTSLIKLSSNNGRDLRRHDKILECDEFETLEEKVPMYSDKDGEHCYVPDHRQFHTVVRSNAPTSFVVKIKIPTWKSDPAAMDSSDWPRVKLIETLNDAHTELYDDEELEEPADFNFSCCYMDHGIGKTSVKYASMRMFCDNDYDPHFIYGLALLKHFSAHEKKGPKHEHLAVFVYSANCQKCLKIVHLDISPIVYFTKGGDALFTTIIACHVDGAGNFVIIAHRPGEYPGKGPHVIVWDAEGRYIKQRILASQWGGSETLSISLTGDGFVCVANAAVAEYFCMDDERIFSDNATTAAGQPYLPPGPAYGSLYYNHTRSYDYRHE